jgi:voltage-gated potassium channel
MTETQLELLEDHVLVLGHGDLTDVILEELGDGEYLIVTTKAEWARVAQENGVDVIVADPSDESTLRRARTRRRTARTSRSSGGRGRTQSSAPRASWGTCW